MSLEVSHRKRAKDRRLWVPLSMDLEGSLHSDIQGITQNLTGMLEMQPATYGFLGGTHSSDRLKIARYHAEGSQAR